MKESINIKNRFLKFIWILLFEITNIKGAKKIIFSTVYEKKETTKVVRVNNFEVIQNFLQCAVSKNLYPKKDYLLYLGRIHPKKGIQTIIQSYFKNFKFKIKIVGSGDDGYLNYLKKLVISKKLKNKIIFLKSIYNEKKNKIYAQAKYSILLSKTENFGNTILESILNYTPVIISKKTGLSDLVEKYKLGYVIKNDVPSLKNIFLKLQNKKKIHKITKKKVLQIFFFFKDDKILNKYLKIFYI
jgi:glycosyltransferase involved in cell wall biosynthesis